MRRALGAGRRGRRGGRAGVAEAARGPARVAAEAVQRSARAEEGSQLALKTIGVLLQDLRALSQRTDTRLDAIENAAAE